MYVAVVGPSAATPEQIGTAEEVGRLLAGHGAIVLTGGGEGVMAAAARGCTAAGGTAIGLLPGVDRLGANPDHGVALATGLGELRNGVLVRGADGVIAVGGSWGTLSEIALATRIGRPVVCLHGWRLRDERDRPIELTAAVTPAAAVDTLLARIAR